MFTPRKSIVLLLFILGGVSTKVHPKLVRHFLLENYIKNVLFLSCASPQEVHNLRKDIQSLHMWTVSADINGDINLNYERLFAYKNHRMAVVVDLECLKIRSVLGEVSKRTYFHQRYFWLIFAENVNQSVAMLGGENINVDAEITVAISEEKSNKGDGKRWRDKEM